jgi:hypothetical protein
MMRLLERVHDQSGRAWRGYGEGQIPFDSADEEASERSLNARERQLNCLFDKQSAYIESLGRI